MLDDGGRDWVRRMTEELGARYLSRPAPRQHAKAGNINHALGYVDAEFIVTLDADHVPRPELVERMLGHMADPDVAVVQGPQAFYNRGFGHPRVARRPAAQRAEHLLRRHLPRQGSPRRGLLVRLPLGAAPVGARRDRRRRHRHRRRGRPHQPAPERERLEGRLPRRGDGPRPRARGDRRLRGAAGPLGARLAADAPPRGPAAAARPHLAPAARVLGELPALPRGRPAPRGPARAAARARHRRRADLGEPAPLPRDLRPPARAGPARLEGPHPRPVPPARGRALLARADGGLHPRPRRPAARARQPASR